MLNGRNGVGKQMAFVVLALLLLNYVILNVLRPGGLMAYFLPSACWGFLAIVALKACGFERIRSWFNGRVTIAALSVAIFFIIILINIGLFAGFGWSVLSFAPTALIINLTLVLSTLLGMEFSRAYLIKSFGRRRPFLTIGLVTLLYSFVTISTFKLLALNDPLGLTKFLGIGLLPIIAGNLLASYLALIGGPVASLAYRGPLMAFWWFCPILPHLSWGIEAFLGVMVPVMGFFLVNQFTSPITLRRAGIPTEPKGFGRDKKSPLRSWMVVSVLAVLMVWASTGLLGIQPTTVLSGSMRPAMDTGDLAIVQEVSADSIGVGDIVQYQRDGTMVIHRVTEVAQGRGEKIFVTKGDANSNPDIEPVFQSQVRGKVVLTIPKLGWAVIAAQSFVRSAWSFLSANVALTALAITSGACIFFGIRLRKNRSVRRWGARRWRRKGLVSRRFMAPLSLILIIMAASGFAYAHWSETLYISGTVTTGTWGESTVIGSYKVLSPYDDELIRDQLSPDNRTLQISVDNVFSSWFAWVGLKIHNEGSEPVNVMAPTYEFEPDSVQDNFEIEEYFYGPYTCGWEIPKEVWPFAKVENLPALPSTSPPQIDPCQHAIVWIKLHSTDNLGAVQISVTV